MDFPLWCHFLSFYTNKKPLQNKDFPFVTYGGLPVGFIESTGSRAILP